LTASSRTRSPSRARPPPSSPRRACRTRRSSRPLPRRARRSTLAAPTALSRASRSPHRFDTIPVESGLSGVGTDKSARDMLHRSLLSQGVFLSGGLGRVV
ncbi:hypothetical protein CI238_04205, partial [Colletotrichum incanum]